MVSNQLADCCVNSYGTYVNGGTLAIKRSKHEAQASKARLQMFEAKQELEVLKTARRNRDNRFALIISASVVAVVVALQFSYFSFGPGAGKVTPSATKDTLALPAATLAQNATWSGNIWMNSKKLPITVDGAKAPQGVSNFIYLADQHFFDGTMCHRLTNKGVFILQCGDPKGDGTGGPGYSFGPIENAPKLTTTTVNGQSMKAGLYKAGTIAMARQSNNASSQGSQFFIVYKDSYFPNDSVGGYTVLGTITAGLNSLNSEIAKGIVGDTNDGKPKGRFALQSVDFKLKPDTASATPTPTKSAGAKK